jgi:hypothetical protein
MMNSTFRSALALTAFATICALPTAVAAQGTSQPMRVVSIDPYGLANQRLTAEAEFCDGPTPEGDLWFGCGLTAGFAATIERHPRPAGSKAARYHVDAEGLVRFGSRWKLTGWWVGLRTGLTFADRYGVGPSLGVDTGVSWLIARRLYVGASVGAKTVFAFDNDSDLRYNPSFRVATGYAF